MILKRKLDLTGTLTIKSLFRNDEINIPWTLDRESVNLVREPYSRTFHRLPYGENVWCRDRKSYHFDFPERAENLGPYISFEIQTFNTTNEIADVVEIFDGPEDLALLWKLSI